SSQKSETADTAVTSEQVSQQDVQAYLDEYSKRYQELYTLSAEAEWASNTKIVDGDTTNAAATRRANEAFAAFTGNVENIEKARTYLEQKDKLNDLQVKQLEAILYAGANNPQIIPDVVKARIKAETEQTEKLYGFDYHLFEKSVTTNDIDNILKSEKDVKKRLAAWNASKEVGPGL